MVFLGYEVMEVRIFRSMVNEPQVCGPGFIISWGDAGEGGHRSHLASRWCISAAECSYPSLALGVWTATQRFRWEVALTIPQRVTPNKITELPSYRVYQGSS